MTVAIADAPPIHDTPPIPLDGLVFGIDWLEAVVVFHLDDGHVHAAWVRKNKSLGAIDIAVCLRDFYRAAQAGSYKLAALSRAGSEDPVVTVETPGRVVLLHPLGDFVVGCLFEASMPLGMAKLTATRLSAAIESELPILPEVPLTPRSTGDGTPSTQDASPGEAPIRTLAFAATGTARIKSSRPPPATAAEIERIRKLLEHLKERAPDPHVVRLRVALRAGVTPLALSHPEALGAEAMVLVETAIEDVLGIDRAELRSLV
jgi:hypothetical protein